jgi:hypothetical protein
MQKFKNAEKTLFILLGGCLVGCGFLGYYYDSFDTVFYPKNLHEQKTITQTRQQGTKRMYLQEHSHQIAIELHTKTSSLEIQPQKLSSLIENLKDIQATIHKQDSSKHEVHHLTADFGQFQYLKRTFSFHDVSIESSFRDHPAIDLQKLLQARAQKVELLLNTKPFHLKAYDLISHIHDEP